MATYRGPTPTTRFRANSKHFLTWSATAANHKLQKLSKHLVNNVNKLGSKFPFHNHHSTSQNQQQSCSDDTEDSSDWETPRMNNGLGRTLPWNNGSSNNGNSSSSANLMANDSLLLNNNNNNDVTMSNSSGGVKASVRNNNISTANRLPLTSSTSLRNSNRDSCPNDNHTKEFKPNSRQNLNEKTALLVKNLLGTQVNNTTFELRPVTSVNDRREQSESQQQLTEVSGCYNDSSNSTISVAGTTLPLNSPHWSRASSMSSSTVGFSNSPLLQTDSLNCNNQSNNRLGHHHLLVESEQTTTRRDVCRKNNNKTTLVPLFSSRSSTGSNHSGTGSGSGRSPSPVDDRLPSPIATSSPINNKLTVTIFEEEAELRHAPWFQAGIPREIALEVLRNESIGSFIVRESTTKSGCFALSMRVPREFQPMGIAHYLILRTGRGYKIKGFTKEFQSLVSLITHHSVMPELLPCPLSLHRYLPKYSRRRINSSDFMEPDQLIPLRKYTDF